MPCSCFAWSMSSSVSSETIERHDDSLSLIISTAGTSSGVRDSTLSSQATGGWKSSATDNKTTPDAPNAARFHAPTHVPCPDRADQRVEDGTPLRGKAPPMEPPQLVQAHSAARTGIHPTRNELRQNDNDDDDDDDDDNDQHQHRDATINSIITCHALSQRGLHLISEGRNRLLIVAVDGKHPFHILEFHSLGVKPSEANPKMPNVNPEMPNVAIEVLHLC
eukprot:72538-Rhodomonas_salina.2